MGMNDKKQMSKSARLVVLSDQELDEIIGGTGAGCSTPCRSPCGGTGTNAGAGCALLSAQSSEA